MGSAFSYGFRVCPIKDDDVSTFSGSSNTSNVEYDIWRRWEDCLWFQETLEIEYTRMARDKRKGLAAGKGVKKDGFYVHSDQAASFESLPPGPDPQSIAKDIHDHVPRLTKKGTLFRATQVTADARARELHAMISSMFSEDLPTLVRELRATRTFTDFFGFWRRDHDLAKKTQKKLGLDEKKPAVPVPARSRHSISTSPLSTMFSASTPSLAGSQPTPPMIVKDFANRRVSTQSNGSSSSDQSIHTTTPPTPSTKSRRSHHKSSEDGRSMRSRTTSTATASSSGSGSSGSIPPSPSLRTPRVVAPHDAPLRFGHNPSDLSLPVADSDRPPLESLPEDRELPVSAKSAITAHGVPETPSIRNSTAGRRRAFSAAGDPHRNARIWNPEMAAASLAEYRRSALLVGVPEVGPGAGEQQAAAAGAHSRAMARQSVATIASTTSSLAARYLADLGMDLALPSEDGASMYDPRASMCTVDSEAWREGPQTGDAILPRLLNEAAMEGPQGANSRAQLQALMQAAGLRRSLSSGAAAGRRHTIRPVSVYPEEEEAWDDWAGRGAGEGEEGGEEYLDAYFDDSVRPPSPPDSRASTPMGHYRAPSPSPSGETSTETETETETDTGTETESELGSPRQARYSSYHYPYIPSIPPFSPLSPTPITRPRASSISTMRSSSSGGSTQSSGSGSGQSHRSAHSMHSMQSAMTSVSAQTAASNATAMSFASAMSVQTAQTTQSVLDGATLAIKATHEATTIVLRVPRALPYEEVRKRVYDKFVTQEKAPVARTFAIAVLMPSLPGSNGNGSGRERSASVSSGGSAERERAQMKFISSAEAWDGAVARSGGKMALRVIGSEVS
ncbi:hypothetical protein CONPUDRAFT_88232 [Coniophora puteana RWD-64-598 SS2]|uniref:PX domain-containing protein n=1 Tax=Coniophora puteana (strain RWD-64-598) TaxID=741705 RepID=A0A5M3MXG7_CONPW|nr:uncharacterized protein CONPUDRAFT_88232 [Coniophora puteana RWD-64-598 SS2]EIW83788.1 hypothetical protein CONPUDRAFT_88232 [Coniophora puteana RWD-64-598 SS2]